jgi:DNA polymerase-4
MREFLARALPFSPLIELVDENGHLFLDVTGTGRLFGPPMDIAWRIRKETRVRLGFDPIWAVGSNKLVAKVATRLVKPTGEYIVEPGAEEEFLRPLSLALLPGLERDELLRLREFHLRRVADVTRLTLPQLEVALGRTDAARSLYEAARGVDRSPVWPVAGPRPVVVVDRGFGLSPDGSGFNVPGSGLTAAGSAQLETLSSKCESGVVVQSAIHNPQSAIAEADTNDAAIVEGALYALAEQAGAELRRRKLAARRVGVVLDYSDGVRLARSATAGTATANDFRLFALAQDALAHAWTRRVRVRRLRLVCDRLIFPPAQLELFPEEAERTRCEEGLVAALDAIRARFGAGAIRAGRVLAAPA